MMFTRMLPVTKVVHTARGIPYELLVFQVVEDGEYRIYVAKGGFGVGEIFAASQDVVVDVKATQGTDLLDALIATAKDDIDRNVFGNY